MILNFVQNYSRKIILQDEDSDISSLSFSQQIP